MNLFLFSLKKQTKKTSAKTAPRAPKLLLRRAQVNHGRLAAGVIGHTGLIPETLYLQSHGPIIHIIRLEQSI